MKVIAFLPICSSSWLENRISSASESRAVRNDTRLEKSGFPAMLKLLGISFGQTMSCGGIRGL